MSKKSSTSPKKARTRSNAKPAFPYTTRPGSLRKFLSEVPKRPKPPKVNREMLGGWSLSGGENATIIRVLKAIGLIDSSGTPTDQYVSFMTLGAGPAVMAQILKSVYKPLFDAVHEPHRESADSLRNLFNIHSSGAETTMGFQIQTFKALADYADFGAAAPSGGPAVSTMSGSTTIADSQSVAAAGTGGPAVHIDLHIHLPADRSARDYEYIIQDIAKYIFGRNPERRGE